MRELGLCSLKISVALRLNPFKIGYFVLVGATACLARLCHHLIRFSGGLNECHPYMSNVFS